MCDALLSCACRIAQFCLAIMLISMVLCASANAQPETHSWTARSATSLESQYLRGQQEFGHTTESGTGAMEDSHSIYRQQIPSAPENRVIRVRPAASAGSDTRPVPASSGILQSSHETLAPVPADNTTTNAATFDTETKPLPTTPATFYDRTRAEPLVPDSKTAASSDGDLIQIVEALQWTVAVLALAVLAVLIMKKYKTPGAASSSTRDIRHVATIPVKNVFQAHLLEIRGQQFLVTTDRNGVKTVTPVPRWEDFESPLDTIPETTATQATGTLTS